MTECGQPFCEETPDGRLWFCHKCPREYQMGFRTRQEVRDHRNSGACRAPPNSRRVSDLPGLYLHSPGKDKRGSRPSSPGGANGDFGYDSGDDGYGKGPRSRIGREHRPLEDFVVEAPPRSRPRRERREDESVEADGDEIETLHADDDENAPDASAAADDDDDRESRARRPEYEFDDDDRTDREKPRARYASLDDDDDSGSGPKRPVPTQQCPHCMKQVHTNGANYTRHVDACQRNALGEPSPHKNGPPSKPPVASCPHCHKMVHTNGANYRRHVEACAGEEPMPGRARPGNAGPGTRTGSPPSDEGPHPGGHSVLLPDVIAECMAGRPEGASLDDICRAVERVWHRIRKPDGSRYKHDLRYTVSNTLTIHNGRFRRASGSLFTLKEGFGPSSAAPSPPLPDAAVPDRDDLPLEERVRRQRARVAEARARVQRESARLAAWEAQLAAANRETDSFAADFCSAMSAIEVQAAASEADRQVREAEGWVAEWEGRLEHLRTLLHRIAGRGGRGPALPVKPEPAFTPIEAAERLRRDCDGEVAAAVAGPSPTGAVPGGAPPPRGDGVVPSAAPPSASTSRADSASPPSADGRAYPSRSRSSSPPMRAASPGSPPTKRPRRVDEVAGDSEGVHPAVERPATAGLA